MSAKNVFIPVEAAVGLTGFAAAGVIFVFSAAAQAGILDSRPAEEFLSADEVKNLIDRGSEVITEAVAAFEKLDKIDWEGCPQSQTVQPLGKDIVHILSEVIKNDISAVDLFLKMLKEGTFRERCGIMCVLIKEKTADTRLVPVLAGMIDAEKAVRMRAVYLLGIQDGEEAVTILRKALKTEKDIKIRQDAAAALAGRGDKKGIKVLENDLRSDDAHFRAETAQRLGNIRRKEILPLLEKAIRKEKSSMVVAALVSSIRRHTGKTDDEVRQEYLGQP